jgi:hypothetical protein
MILFQNIGRAVLFCVLLSLYSAKAQRYNYNDAVFWGNIYLEKSLGNKFDIHLNQQDRMYNNLSTFYLAYADMGFTYNASKHFKVLADYVLIDKRQDNGSFALLQQAYVAFILRTRIRRFGLMYRNMTQSFITRPLRVNDDRLGKWPFLQNRNKFTIKYYLNKRFTLYVAEELFFPIYQVKRNGFSRSRSFIGTFYRVGRHSELEWYFAYQTQLNAPKITHRLFIYGMGYAHEF